MKQYTLWKMDDTKWVLEIEDEAMGEYFKAMVQDPKTSKVERLGVGINTPLRVYMVEDSNVLAVEKIIEQWIRKNK